MTILVIGSFMMDQVVTTPRSPKNGETIIGNDFEIMPGGKGANQTVAISKLDGGVVMAGKLGNDAYGKEFKKLFKQEHIITDYIEVDETTSTGVGFITKEINGNNRIIVIPGANLNYNKQELTRVKAISKSIDIVMFQLEMSFELTVEAIEYYAEVGVPVLLNPAPARKLSKELLAKITYLTPNESELELLTGITINSIDKAIEASKELLKSGVRNVIVTLGDKGALIVNKSISQLVPGYEVNVVDTVAAGDAFNGALVHGLTEGKSLIEAVKFANLVGALTVTKKGAIPSLPSLDEVRAFINEFYV